MVIIYCNFIDIDYNIIYLIYLFLKGHETSLPQNFFQKMLHEEGEVCMTIRAGEKLASKMKHKPCGDKLFYSLQS